MDSQAQVLVELLQRVSPLSSEELEDILRLVRPEEIHNLGLVEDRIFVSRVSARSFK